jgi:hypothetical protein
MGLRALAAAGTMAIGVGLAGWGAAGLAGWTSGPAEQNRQETRADTPDVTVSAATPDAATSALPTRRVTTSRITVAAHEPTAQAPQPQVQGWHPSLFDPDPIAPSQAPALQTPTPQNVAPSEEQAAAEPPAEPRRNLRGEKKTKRKPDNFDGTLTLAQITQIKRRLRLTPEQEENWRPVEAALRDLVQRQARSGRRITLSALEMQNLYFAAGPLVMSLRDDQKQEARNLARAMGLETVAELI